MLAFLYRCTVPFPAVNIHLFILVVYNLDDSLQHVRKEAKYWIIIYSLGFVKSLTLIGENMHLINLYAVCYVMFYVMC